ncbi:hypothetical protein [Variovorax ginsengisoli]|uniref:Thioesterase domain-containing protein n=1 Tax=Variovorax ginsengisoli TaxID=363844 RepID=A0ABT9SE59_9BURK|nr:hypothetical protein [Variovorax ginsengisoli]MDP9902026.1 hypothetical protein [Variovorax ginsengisoli]
MVLQAIGPIVSITAALTFKSDTQPVKVYVKKPRGTLYWGGAGLDGPYIKPQMEAFQRAGIEHVNIGLTNTANKEIGDRIGPLIDAIRAGLLIRYEDDDEWVITSGMTDASAQFNLIGYSYGSLLAAQTANFYANKGHVIDHLVMIASPISEDFLTKLKGAKNIKKVVVVDLTQFGDPIHAGISQAALIEGMATLKRQQDAGLGEGHFYYAHIVKDSKSRWNALAQKMVAAGLR